MKLILTQRERLASLGQFLVDEFDSLVARIRASWNIEHTAEGAHAHVHAESVATGRVVFSDIVSDVLSASDAVHNYNPDGLSTASLLRIDTTHSVAAITGLQVPQDGMGVVLDGRVLVIENVSSTSTLRLLQENTSSAPRNRFVLPWVPSSDNNAFLVLMPGSLTTVIYNATKARWVVHSHSNEQIANYAEFGSSQNDYLPSGFRSARIVRLVPTASALTISGFDITNIPYPSTKTITNDGLYTFSILHQNTSSVAANRVQCPGGVRYRVHPRESVDLHRTRDGNWIIVAKADQWGDVTFDAGNFTTDVGTWTVASGDQTTYAYQLDGNKMTVSFDLRTTTVATNPTELRIAVPLGRTIARTMSNSIMALDNGAEISTAYVQATAGNAYLQVFKNLAAGAWTAATDATRVQGQITFMVRDDCAAISELHTDVAHGDTAHSDVDHSDVSHSDVAHSDTHSDTPHSDGSHSDVAHSDTHSDVAHSDVTHSDTHTDVAHVDVAHTDVAHEDVVHEDVEHQDHDDEGTSPQHEDEAHADEAHADAAHSDTAHSDTAHSDTHDDVAHTDVVHSDTHSDVAHSDSTHSDVAHTDTHSDSVPHSDVAHVDSGHGDTSHSDSSHQDVGQHCDTSHIDV